MKAYYNEIDPYCVQWLRNLIDEGLIADGDVDNRSISDVKPNELKGYTQCHFFAGIGLWSLALRQTGWSDDRPVWTGSCPCQPFSEAGSRKGTVDERHLWPHWFHLITQCCPPTVFGEQVASKLGLDWFDTVQTDMEASGYSVGSADLCAASVGAPHIRQRLWFVGHSEHQRLERLPRNGNTERDEKESGSVAEASFSLGDMANTSSDRLTGQGTFSQVEEGLQKGQEEPWVLQNGSQGCWSAADWLYCKDGKLRPVEPGVAPMAPGDPSRVGRLRAYGNSINVEVARVFIDACRV